MQSQLGLGLQGITFPDIKRSINLPRVGGLSRVPETISWQQRSNHIFLRKSKTEIENDD